VGAGAPISKKAGRSEHSQRGEVELGGGAGQRLVQWFPNVGGGKHNLDKKGEVTKVRPKNYTAPSPRYSVLKGKREKSANSLGGYKENPRNNGRGNQTIRWRQRKFQTRTVLGPGGGHAYNCHVSKFRKKKEARGTGF